MASITSAQAGDWNTASTWGGGAIPTASDDVSIGHAVTIAGNAAANTITINSGGSLTSASTWAMDTKVTLTVGRFVLRREMNDRRAVRLDGITLALTEPAISSRGPGGSFPPMMTDVVNTANTVIIDDPGVISFSAQMQDIKPEGCAIAYSRKVSNGVRYMTVTVHIKADRCDIIGRLYRMAELPFQVLASTYSGVLKGFIEAITPVDSVGKEYRSFRVSIAEGQSE